MRLRELVNLEEQLLCMLYNCSSSKLSKIFNMQLPHRLKAVKVCLNLRGHHSTVSLSAINISIREHHMLLWRNVQLLTKQVPLLIMLQEYDTNILFLFLQLITFYKYLAKILMDRNMHLCWQTPSNHSASKKGGDSYRNYIGASSAEPLYNLALQPGIQAGWYILVHPASPSQDRTTSTFQVSLVA